MRLIKFIREHKIASTLIALLIFLIPIVVVHILFKITTSCKWIVAEWDAGDLLSYCGAVLGAVATIVSIVLTIMFTVENQKFERKLTIKPCLNTNYIPKFIRIDSIVKEGQCIYITYPFDNEGNIKASHIPPHVLKKAEQHKAEGILDTLAFYRENHIIHYTVSNIGAGNAVNIKFSIDEKLIMQPFAMVANTSKEFIIVLKPKLLNCGNHFIRFKFEYEDVASIGKYEQHERIEFYLDDDKSLNTRQAINDSISMPKDL